MGPRANRPTAWWITIACAVTVVVTAVAILVGWTLEIQLLRYGFIGEEPMRPTAALSLLFAGLALLQRRPALRAAFSLLTLLLGAITTVDWILRVELFGGEQSEMRMSARAALMSVLAGLSGLLSARRRASQLLAAGTAFLAMLSILAFAYGGKFLAGPTEAYIAPTTAILFAVWSFGSLVSKSRGLTTAGTGMTSLAVTTIVGGLCLAGVHAGYFNFPFALALLATASGFGLVFVSRTFTARLHEREMLYRTIVQTAQEGICVADAEGRLALVNERLASMLGSTSAAMDGRPVTDFVSPFPGDRQRDVRLRREDGGELLAIASSCPLRNDASVETGRLMMFTDITERARAEAALRESEQRFRSLYDAEIVGVVYFTTDGRVLQANDEMLRLFGITQEELPSWNWRATAAPGSVEADAAALEELRATCRFRPYERECVRADGSRLWILVTGAHVAEGDGANIAFVLDITDRVEARRTLLRTHASHTARGAELEGAEATAMADVESAAARLAAANQELETFSYSVSHDLRTPLRAIDGFSRELAISYADRLDARGRNYLDRIRAATQRMSHLIDDLLDLARLSRKPLRRVPVDVTSLVREIADGSAAEVQVAEGLTAAADPQLLRVVLENLIGNAVKFSAQSERPCVEVFARNGDLAVRDNGTGFDMQYVDKIFAPFQRLHDSQYEGTGIGLALVQRIVHRHGGSIRAESTPGQGATFYFNLGKTA